MVRARPELGLSTPHTHSLLLDIVSVFHSQEPTFQNHNDCDSAISTSESAISSPYFQSCLSFETVTKVPFQNKTFHTSPALSPYPRNLYQLSRRRTAGPEIPSPSGLTGVGKSVQTSMSTNQQAPSPSGRGLEPAPYPDTGVRVKCPPTKLVQHLRGYPRCAHSPPLLRFPCSRTAPADGERLIWECVMARLLPPAISAATATTWNQKGLLRTTGEGPLLCPRSRDEQRRHNRRPRN